MKPNQVRLFIKTGCPWCREAEAWLRNRSVAYQATDVRTDAKAFAEMQRLSGQTRAPVIDVDGRVLADFGADELDAWWKQQGFAA